MLDYRLEHILSFSATLKAPEVIGPLPEGIRAHFYATGGNVEAQGSEAKFFPWEATG